MNRKIEVKVPVPRYVKKFLERTYRYEKGAIYVRRDETLGIIIESMLEKNFTSHPPKPLTGTYVVVKIYQDAKLLHVPENRIHYLTKILTDEFDEALKYYTQCGYALSRSYEPHIKRFLEIYDVTDDELSVNSAAKKLRDIEERIELKQRKFCDVS